MRHKEVSVTHLRTVIEISRGAGARGRTGPQSYPNQAQIAPINLAVAPINGNLRGRPQLTSALTPGFRQLTRKTPELSIGNWELESPPKKFNKDIADESGDHGNCKIGRG